MDWSELYLFTLIFMRMTGFILFNPILGRSTLTNFFRAGMIMVLSVFVMGVAGEGPAALPGTVVEFGLRLLLELGIGFVLSFVMQLLFMIIQVGGEIIDNQMGLTMAQIYDASSKVNMTVTAYLLNVLLVMDFFAENGHYTILRIFLGSQQVVPFGEAAFGQAVASGIVEVFLSNMVLALKLAMPILAAELLGEVGMGILMKAIPQINAFVINIELKVIVGLVLLFLFLSPINEFLLEAEKGMLNSMGRMLEIIGASG